MSDNIVKRNVLCPDGHKNRQQTVEVSSVTKDWSFRVFVNKLEANERVCLIGDCERLGNWKHDKVVLLNKEENTEKEYSVRLKVPANNDVHYRYCICLIDTTTNEVQVTKWETHAKPRKIKTACVTPPADPDVFGVYNGETKIDQGWLSAGFITQFKFYNQPIEFYNDNSYKNISVLITPVDSGYNTCDLDILDSEVVSPKSPQNVQCYAAVLSDGTNCRFKPPADYGVEYTEHDFLIYKISTCSSKLQLTYIIDIFNRDSSGKPIKIGYCFITPHELNNSDGAFKLTVVCPNKHRPLGTIRGEYLVIRPTSGLVFNMEKSYSSYWKQSWVGLDVGHRGNGASFKEDNNIVRENTIASLNTAKENGADIVEFDVQLSKDLVPVIYHDFNVCVSLENKHNIPNNEVLELPLKDLTFDQLQSTKLYHVGEQPSNERFNDMDLIDNQPFPLLADFLTKIDENLGFNVEIKWPMKEENGSIPLKDSFDMNIYIDKILEVIFCYAKNRMIFFSCFNPEVCVMLSTKQNLYPVMFLTQGITKKWSKLFDPRCNTIQYAIFNALNSNLLGIVVHTEDLLRDPTQIILAREAGLVLLCWGEDNNNKETIQNLKELGLHGVIFDRMDKYSAKNVKESIFSAEDKQKSASSNATNKSDTCDY